MIINPYKVGSRSAKALKGALNERSIKTFVLQRVPKSGNAVVVNWGNSKFEYVWPQGQILNLPWAISELTNKKKFFHRVGHSDLTVPWTYDTSEAMAWHTKTVARFKLEASGGEGIVVFDPALGGKFPIGAPLYTKYVPKTAEYRVHIGRSLNSKEFRILHVQRKIFRKTPENPTPKDWNVRNHANGFVYVVNSGEPVPEIVPDTAIRFMGRHFPDVHFAALDLLYHNKAKHAWVLEGNTAPGLEGQTVEVYANYIAEAVRA